VHFDRVDGSLLLTGGQVRFNELGLALACAGRNEGLMRLNGSYGVHRGNDNLELHGTWTAGELASPIVIEAMRLIGAEREAEQFQGFQPSGSFDAEFSYRSPRNGEPRRYSLIMHPDTVDVHVNETSVRLSMDPDSAVIVEEGVVTIDNVTGSLGEGAFAAAGSALIGDDDLEINLFIDYRGRLSHRDVQAILPRPARDALAAVEFSDGPDSHLRDAKLHLKRVAAQDDAPHDDQGTRAWATTFTGVVETDDAAFRGGVPFDRVNGTFDVNVAHAPGGRPKVLINALAGRLRVFENTMTDAEAAIELVAADELVVRDFRAEMFGGAVAGDASFGVGQRADYNADVTMAGVGVLGLMEDEDEQEQDLPPYDPPSAMGRRSGKIFASVSVQGRRGQQSAQTGRGTIRIADGRLARMPLLLGLLQIMELMPPLSDSLNFADADFYIEGGDMVFEEIFVECPTLQLRGRGRMDLATMNVDVLFRSRGTLALVGDIVGGISDQLYGIRVSGPLTDPDAELVPLPGLSDTRSDTPEPSASAPRATAVAR